MRVVVFADDSERLAAELALLDATVAEMRTARASPKAPQHSAPRVVVAVLGGVPSQRGSAARRQALDQIAERVLRLKASLLPERSVVRVVGAATHREPSSVRRVLEASEKRSPRRRSLQSVDPKTAKFAGFDYVLMSWTIGVLVFVVLFVFLCIPWAPQLDAELLSTIKSGGDKRD